MTTLKSKSTHNVGKKARNKGANGEREVIKALTEYLSGNVAKVPEFCRNLAQTQHGGSDLVVKLDKDTYTKDCFGFAIEIKRVETNFQAVWWRQAVEQAGDTLEPVVVYRQSKQPWRVCLKLPISVPGYVPFHAVVHTTLETFAEIIARKAEMAQYKAALTADE